MVISSKVKHTPILRSSNSTPRHLPKGHEWVCPQKDLHKEFMAVLFLMMQNWEPFKCPDLEKDKLLMHTDCWMNTQNIARGKRSQTPEYILCVCVVQEQVNPICGDNSEKCEWWVLPEGSTGNFLGWWQCSVFYIDAHIRGNASSFTWKEFCILLYMS